MRRVVAAANGGSKSHFRRWDVECHGRVKLAHEQLICPRGMVLGRGYEFDGLVEDRMGLVREIEGGIIRELKIDIASEN